MKSFYVYILASKPGGTLYIGVTNSLRRRLEEHASGNGSKFTKKYNVHLLVYYEQTENIESAIRREKNLKKWNRQWKVELIEKENPEWKNLSDELFV